MTSGVIVTVADPESPVVVDASALAALVFGEPDAEKVAGQLTGHRLVAPTLLRYEMASVYVKKLRRYPGERSALSKMFRVHLQLGIEEVQPDMHALVQLAERTGLTAYDAAYLWLAKFINAPVITLDEQLAHAARVIG